MRHGREEVGCVVEEVGLAHWWYRGPPEALPRHRVFPPARVPGPFVPVAKGRKIAGQKAPAEIVGRERSAHKFIVHLLVSSVVTRLVAYL